MATLCAREFQDASKKLGLNSDYAFKSSFGIHPKTAAEVWNLLLLPGWAEPVHLLVLLNLLTEKGRDDVDAELEKIDPRHEIFITERLDRVLDSITELYTSIVPSQPVPRRQANVRTLNSKLGINVELAGSQALKSSLIRRALEAFNVLEEMKRKRDGMDPTLKVDLAELSTNWGILSTRWIHLDGLVDTMRAIAVLECLDKKHKIKAANLSALSFRQEAAKFGCETKDQFLESFGMHPQLCADLWNEVNLPFRAKPKLLLGTLVVLKGQETSPFGFDSKQQTDSEWVQRMLDPISALYDSAIVKRTLANTKHTFASLSADWKILEDSESLKDPKVFRSIVVLNHMINDWKILRAGPKSENGRFMVGPTREEFDQMKQAFRAEFPEGSQNYNVSGWEACCETLESWLSMAPQKLYSFKGTMIRRLKLAQIDDTAYASAFQYVSRYMPVHLPLSDEEKRVLHRLSNEPHLVVVRLS